MASASEEFCEDFLVLKPEEGGVRDLLHLLFSCQTEKNNYTECPQGTETKRLERRWLLFVSVLAQKVILSMKRPMVWFGSRFEMWMNLLSCNRNLFGLLLNLYRGEVVVPDPASETFISTIGMIDDRVELDENIKYGDSGYYEALSVMAAKISYENEAFIRNTVTNHWKMEFLGSYDFWNDYQEQLSTQAFMFRDKRPDSELIMVAFRGTPPFNAEAWSTDVDISWYEIPNIGKVHGGFMKALGLQKTLGWPKDIGQGDGNRPVAYYTIREKLREMLRMNENARFIVTGHSLGGALAILFPVILAYHGENSLLDKCEGIFTYGQPRVGDEKLGAYMDIQLSEHNVPYVRCVYSNDMVPRLPYDDSTQLFKHFGTCIYYDSLYQGKIVEEEPNKNYFSIIMVIPKILTAVWELLRSFGIQYVKGPEYDEGLVMRIFRVIGLIVPGIPAHTPQDYVNSTRLCTTILPLEVQYQTRPIRKLD